MTPAPDTFTAVVPVKLVPVSVAVKLLLRACEMGEIVVSVGPTTVNAPARELLVAPFVVTVTFLALRVAPVVMVKFAVTWVPAEFTVTPLAVTPVPDTVTAVVPVRLAPVMVTGTTVPRAPDVGAIEFSVGPTTVNVTPLLIPAGVVTVTVLALRVAPVVMVKLAVT